MTASPRRSDSLKLATASRALPLVAGYGLNLLVTPLIAASLGLSQFGLWALTGSLAQYGSLLDFGVSRSVTRFTALHLAEDDTRAADRVAWTAGTLVLGVGLPLLLLGLGLSGPVASVIGYKDTQSVRLVFEASLVILVTGQFATILTGSAFGREVQTLPNKVTTACGVLGQATGAMAAVISRDVVVYGWAVAAWNTVTFAVMALVIHRRIARLRPTRPSWATLRQLASFGVKGQSVVIAELVVFQASKLLLGGVAGTATAGAYELGSRLALGFRTLGQLFVGALTAPLTRSFAELGLGGMRRRADQLSTPVAALSVVPPLLGAALGPALLATWVGDYEGLTLATTVALCLGFASNSLSALQGVLAEAVGRPGLTARPALLTAALSVVLGAVMLAVSGPVGLVCATGGSIVVGSVYNVALVQPAVGSTQAHYYRLVGGPVVLAVLCAVAAFGSTLLVSTDTRWQAGIAVSTGALVFVCLYVPLAVARGYLRREWFLKPFQRS